MLANTGSSIPESLSEQLARIVLGVPGLRAQGGGIYLVPALKAQPSSPLR